jgi:hypothetical protein
METTCGHIWSSSLIAWVRTAPTTEIALDSPSTVYYEVSGTTKSYTVTLLEWYTGSARTTDPATTRTDTFTQDDGRVTTTRTQTYSLNTEYEQLSSPTSTTAWDITVTGHTSILSTVYSQAYYLSSFTYTPSAPCCSTCAVFGGSVQVYAWPTPAPSPPVSTVVGQNFTL